MRRLFVTALFSVLIVQPLAAQFPTTGQNIATPSEPLAIPLYKGDAPGWEKAAQRLVWSKMGPQRWERNVTHPSIIPILPPAGKANGAAVLVVPGGGFQFLSIDNEGYGVAARLNAHGITAFILQYRTMPTPYEYKDFLDNMAKVFNPKYAGEDKPDLTKGLAPAVADAQAALKFMRANVTKYHIDPKRIGMIGFSAGAMTTFGTIMADDPRAIPDYAGIIYGPTSMDAAGPGAKVPADAPPMFNALARDDMFFANQNLSAIEAWRGAKKQVEFHMYEGGGHGFASFPSGHTSDHWFDQFIAWMKANKWLEAK